MSDDLVQVLSELHEIVNNFRIRGQGVMGNLVEGYAVEFLPPNAGPTDVPEGPEGPEIPEQ